MTFVVGTASLQTRACSHAPATAAVRALRRYLSDHGIWAWAKPDPTAIGVPVPGCRPSLVGVQGCSLALRR